jgi:hypothetical protein
MTAYLIRQSFHTAYSVVVDLSVSELRYLFVKDGLVTADVIVLSALVADELVLHPMHVYPSDLSGTAYVPEVTAFFALYESTFVVMVFPDKSVPKFPPFASNLIEYVRMED